MTGAVRKSAAAWTGISASIIVGIISMLSAIILFPLVVSNFGANSYGVWLFLFALANLLFFTDLGIGTAMVHFISRYRGGDASHAPSAILNTGLLCSIVSLAVATPIYWLVTEAFFGSLSSIPTNASETVLLKIAGYAIVVGLIIRPFTSGLLGAGAYAAERGTQAAGVLFRVVLTIIGCLAPWGSISTIAIAEAGAVLLPSLIAAGLLPLRLRGVFAMTPISKSAVRTMLGYSARSFSVSLTGALIMQAGPIVLGVYSSPSAVTYFSAAFRVYTVIRQMLGWILDPFRSAYSRTFAAHETSPWTLLRTILGVTIIVSLVGVTSLFLCLEPLITVWLGDEVPNAEVATMIQVLLLGLILNSIHLPLAPLVDAFGRPGVFLLPQLLWLMFFVALSIALAPVFGGVGVAIAMATPLVIVEPLYLWIGARLLRFSLGSWFREVLCASVLPLLPGLVLAVAVNAAISNEVGTLFSSLISLIVWVTSVSLMFFLRKSKPPLSGFKPLLRMEL